MIGSPTVGTAGARLPCRPDESGSASRRVFIGATVLLFAASAAVLVWHGSMSPMGDVPMSGGWALSSIWAPLCGQSWSRAAIGFLDMWMTMMVAMMLPSLAPVLWRYRQSLYKTGIRFPGSLIVITGVGYFFAWALPGVAAYPFCIALAQAVVHTPTLARAVPMLSGAIVTAAGLLQFTAWKTRHLHACKQLRTDRKMPAGALRQGFHLGLHCICSCSGFTAALLATGVMNPLSMTIMTAVVTIERAPSSDGRAIKAIGVCLAGAGITLFVQAAGPG